MPDNDASILAAAILELAGKCAVEWDYDGEQMHGTGVCLSLKLDSELQRIAARKSNRKK